MKTIRPQRTRTHGMGTGRFAHTLVCLWLGALLLARSASGLPLGFIAEVLSDEDAVSGTFARHPQTGDPMFLLVAKKGRVFVLHDFDRALDNASLSSSKLSSQTILDLGRNQQMCTNGERGLQNVVVHPDFAENRYVYLFYTKFREGCLTDESLPANDHPYNVVARYTMDPETLLLKSRREIWRGAPLHDSLAVHNGGAMVFGNDGKLWVTHGDAGFHENAQRKTTVLGSLLRLNDDGSTPSDNPFVKGYDAYHCGDSRGRVPRNASEDTAVCSEIFATGLRNPFRMALDANTQDKTLLTIQDVGGRTWEELSHGGTDYAGRDYGWKAREGPCERHSLEDCPIPLHDSELVDPFHYYMHRDDKSGCVSGAAFVPEGVWPAEYTFVFADFVFYALYTLTEDPKRACRACTPPVSGFRNETFFEPTRYPGQGKNQGRIVDLMFGPYEDTQALYVITYGDMDSVIRIRHTGVMDEPPVAKLSADQHHVKVNEAVAFDGSGSYDPEGHALSYAWYFGGSNDRRGPQSTEANPTHRFDKPGSYRVTLMVKDVVSQVQQTSTTILVGDLPEATIVSPAEGHEFFVGEILRLEGKASYPNGTAFNDSQLEWEVRKHHDDHYHPFLDPIFGNGIELSPAPEPEDFYASTNSYLEVILRATDEDGLTRTVARNIQPSLVRVGIHSNLDGLQIQVNEEKVSTSSQIVSWRDQRLDLKARTDDDAYGFVAWSDGVEETSRSVVVDASNPVYTARFCAREGTLCSEAVPCCGGYACRTRAAIEAVDQRSGGSVVTICVDEDELVPTGVPETASPTVLIEPEDLPSEEKDEELEDFASEEELEEGVASEEDDDASIESKASNFADKNVFLLALFATTGLFLNQ